MQINLISTLGGCGGGILMFNMTEEFRVDGVVSSNGGDSASTSYSGGGAGGSIFIFTKELDGTGSIEV